MKHLMLATVASLALSLPAMAQSNMQPNSTPAPQSQQMNQMNNHGASARNGEAHSTQAENSQQTQNRRQAENVIRPSQLSHQQVRRIQQALNKKGFDAKHVDGIWGRETIDALNNFQKKNNLQGHGELTQQTLAQLGVSINGPSQQGSATTGSGSNESGVNQPSQNPGMTNPDRSGSQTNGQGTDGSGQASGSHQMNQSPSQPSGAMNSSGQSSGSMNSNSK